MTGNTHAVCGVAVAACIFLTYPEVVIFSKEIIAVPALLGSFAGSLLPDIDIPQSTVGSKVRWFSRFLKHRGITHTLLFPAILALLVYYIPAQIPVSLLFGICIGWLAHIFADLFNRKGVPLLFPLTKTHIHLASFKTRSWHEAVFIIFWIGGLVLCYHFLLTGQL